MEVEVRDTVNMEGRVWHKKNHRNYWHREDGPALIMNNGTEDWWYNNRCYTEKMMPLNLFLVYCKWEYKKHGK